MSSPPEGWVQPKTDWANNDPIGTDDLNRIERNEYLIELGTRTIYPTIAPPQSNTGSLRQFLDWFANRIGAIIGGDWKDVPGEGLLGLYNHTINAITSGVHGLPYGAGFIGNAGGLAYIRNVYAQAGYTQDGGYDLSTGTFASTRIDYLGVSLWSDRDGVTVKLFRVAYLNPATSISARIWVSNTGGQLAVVTIHYMIVSMPSGPGPGA